MNAKILLGLAIVPLILGGCTNKCGVSTNAAKGDVSASSTSVLENSGQNNVYFHFAKSNLTKDAKERVKYQASQINSNDHVTLEGRTDERGTSEFNMALGAKRAEAVKKELEKNGVNRDNITTISYGKDSPVGSKSDYKDIEEYHARNRVVTTVVETR
ncbi:MAG: OmpA family protein [Alphaproteobacteria bacterium]|nr:OmpA family protein [Alphaproteobacteria bacterium]